MSKEKKNFRKTWKNECLSFGTCTARGIGNILLVTFGDDRIVMTGRRDQIGILGRVSQFVEVNGTAFYADKVVEHIKDKL